MSLILCRQEPVKCPYYFESLGVRLYSSQELCYVIYNNPLLVMEGFVGENLIDFIRRELDMSHLAVKLEKRRRSGEEDDELLLVILRECDYYHADEIASFKQKLLEYRKLPVPGFLKVRADFLFSGKQYGKAALEYQKIADMGDGAGDEAFRAKVCNNLGSAYARLFLPEKALKAYEKSLELAKNNEVLKRISHLIWWKPSLVISERLQALLTEELEVQCKAQRERAKEKARRGEGFLELEELFQKDPVKRLSEAGEVLNRWKQEYRKMMS